ncbi:MAG: hypothetical protein FH748_07180 [Balneolaceae bacterium]|nr:hypothetical protein [Balneolaceae bacterium]
MTELGFYILPFIMFLTTFLILRNSPDARNLSLSYISIFFLWTAYILVLVRSGILSELDLPPRIPLLVVIPAILIILFLTSREIMKAALKNTPPSTVIYMQSFRIVVELLIYGAYLNNVFPKIATFEGINYDIVVGITALIVGFLTQKQIIGKKIIALWNIASLCILTVTVYSFISTYYFTDYASTTENFEFLQLPYVFLASILLPYAIFLHVASIRQVVQLSEKVPS